MPRLSFMRNEIGTLERGSIEKIDLNLIKALTNSILYIWGHMEKMESIGIYLCVLLAGKIISKDSIYQCQTFM